MNPGYNNYGMRPSQRMMDPGQGGMMQGQYHPQQQAQSYQGQQQMGMNMPQQQPQYMQQTPQQQFPQTGRYVKYR